MSDKTIRIIYGSDIINNTKTLLSSYQIETKIPSLDAKIGLKPNLVVATTPDTGATTHTQIICGIIEYLQEKGFKNISIIEGAWVGDSTQRGFFINGYDKISKKYNVALIDTKKDEYNKHTAYGITMEISKSIENLDYLINLPVLKGHCQTYMTCAMKNLKGCLSDRSKRMFHSLGLVKPIAVLNTIVKPNITLVDGICGDLDFEEGGTPTLMERLFLAEDPVLMDTYAASLLGFSLDAIGYIKLGESLKAGSTNLKEATILELNQPTTSALAKPTNYASRLSNFTAPSSACSCCYANLIHALKRMEDKGTLSSLKTKEKIAIGQGYKGKEMDLGVGLCCSKAKHGVIACPPQAKDIIKMLEEL